MLSHVDNHDDAVRAAQDHGSGDSSMYSSALAHVNQNQVRRTGLKIRHVHYSLRSSCVIRASIQTLLTRTLSKMRIVKSMSRVPVVVCLHRPWVALRPSRYALPKLVRPLFKPPSSTGVEEIHIGWWRRRWRRFAHTTDQHGYGRGVQALRSAWRCRW
jgi:hypothetical protein